MLAWYHRIRCPICNRKMVFWAQNQYRCSKCGSVFVNGIGIQDAITIGQPHHCPACDSESTYYEFRFRTYYCRRCGSRFSNNRTIIEEREIQICPRCNSWSTRFRSSSLTYICNKCKFSF